MQKHAIRAGSSRPALVLPSTRVRRRILGTSAVALLASAISFPAEGVEIFKANNTTALNLPASWTGGVVPGPLDVATWNSAITAPHAVAIGGDLSWDGIRVTDVGGTRNGTNNVTITSASSANTLTIGAAGIDMSLATQVVILQPRITLSANQTWNIANASTATGPAALNENEDLALFSQAAATPMNMGGFTVTKAGAGAAVFSSGWTMSNGSWVVNEGLLHIQGGSNRVTTVENTVNFTVNNGGILRLAAQSGVGGLSTQFNAPITLNTGSRFEMRLNQNNRLDLTGTINVAGNTTWTAFAAGHTSALSSVSGNLVGSGNITYQNTATGATGFVRLTGDNSGYTGTITLNAASNNRILRLVSPTSGTAAGGFSVAADNILQVDGTSVQIGTLSGAGTVTNSHASLPANLQIGQGTFTGTISDGVAATSVTKVGPGTLRLLGANTYTGPTLVNAGTLLMNTDLLSATNVTVADGAAFGVRVQIPGLALSLPSLTTGASTVIVDTGDLGNLQGPGLEIGTFTPQGATTVQLAGTNFVPGTFTLLDYSGTIGGVGFAGLTLSLPPRVVGNFVNNAGNTSIDLTITSLDAPKWTGAVNGDWDIDAGGGTGTANWREITSNNVTKYLQGAAGGDRVLFDDSATGSTTVNLTTALSPGDVTVNNTGKTYTFTGAGSLGGPMKLIKQGTGTLVIANTVQNTYAGATQVDAGTLQVGDGATAGAGTLGTGAIELNGGALAFNRPDDATFANVINGAGGLTKLGTATTTVSGAATISGPISLSGGVLNFTGGGNLSGAVSGGGGLSFGGGIMTLSGDAPNTFTGPVTVTAGTLQLQKSPSARAVSDQILISGTGVMNATFGDQIPDTATVTYNSDGAFTIIGNDVIANAIVQPSPVPGGVGQLISNIGLVISDTLTVNGRVFAVASGHSGTANRIVINGGTLRIAANSGSSTLNVGPGGITTNGGVIEVGQGTGAFDAVVNLEGDLTTTANLEINRGGFTGFEKREINLVGASRTMNIATGTTTNIRPELTGAAGLTKAGGGTLNLLGLVSYAGPTVVSAGTLLTSTSQTNTSAITVADGGALAIRVSTLTPTLTVPALTLGSATGGQLTIDYGAAGLSTNPVISAAALSASGTTALNVTGTFAAGVYPLVDYTGTIGGAGFNSFALNLPFRVVGALVNNTANSSLDLSIAGVDTPRWEGNLSAVWDFDNGTGTGTPNFKGNFSNSALRYVQSPANTDSVLFDDNAAGPTTVSLASELTPRTVTVNNINKTYRFDGPGFISGTGNLVKTGAGTLIVATDNTYTGGTNIQAGTIDLGGGTGAGSLGTGPIVNNGTLLLNRSANFDVPSVISGTGTIIKRNSGTSVGLTAANPNFDGELKIEEGRIIMTNATGIGSAIGATTVSNGAALYFITGGAAATSFETLTLSGTGAFGETTGALRFGSAGLTFSGPVTLAANTTIGVDNAGQTNNISGPISGPGALTKTGAGTLALTEFETNTYLGNTLVQAGILQLNKADGINAIPGDVLIEGGAMNWLQPNQVADNASITLNTGSLNTGNRLDTIANLTINAATPVSTFSGLNITGTLTVTAGAQHDAVNSAGATTANRAVLSNTSIRLGANSGPSTLNIGPGGLSMDNANIVYGSAGTAAQTGLVNLGGDFTGNGNNVFDINTGNPISQVDLGSVSRIFAILTGTTTIEAIIQSATATSGINKTGPGTLVLTATNTYTGDTVVQEGVLDVRGSILGSASVLLKPGTTLDAISAPGGFQVGLGQTLRGRGTVTGNTLVNGALAPGEGIGTLNFNGDLSLFGTAEFELNKTGLALSADLAAVTGLLAFGGALNVTLTGDAVVAGDSFDLFNATAFSGSFASFNLPTLGAGLFWDTTRLGVDGTLAVVPEPVSAVSLALGAALLGLRRRRR
jgi:autotransporter-associated beta strand protein